MNEDQSCAACMFFRHKNHGQCRRYPPRESTFRPSANAISESFYPRVDELDIGCGEFKLLASLAE